MNDSSSPTLSSAEAQVAGGAAPTAAPAGTPAPAAPLHRGMREFRWYMAGYAAFFIGMGLNQVLFQYLILTELGESPARFSIAQTVGMIPMLMLIVFGGAIADRSELRGLLMRLQLLSAVPSFVLAAIVGTNHLTFLAMIVFGGTMGSILAFAGPARDSFLTDVANRTSTIEIPRAVSIATLVQFGSQLLGFALAGLADTVGAAPLLVAFALAHCTAALCTLRVSPSRGKIARAERKRESFLQQFGGGFKEVWASEQLRVITVAMFFFGIVGMGGNMVIMPIIISDTYGGGAMGLSALSFFMQAGTAVTALILSARRPVRRQGRLMIFCLSGGVIAMTTAHFHPPLYVLYPLIFFWGMAGGVWMNLSRAIIQETAPPTHRARILSIFWLGMLGGAPLGMLLAGWFVSMFGPLNAILFPPAGFVLVGASLLTLSRFWHFERPQPRTA